ncbi:nuclear transport factor 2 family protein [Luteithermobacter gelatinilyticus]|uniref:nuclear transport factor 2 family protein n=1 Tax=Luteithermobacter gelatinilyticus TaxID=2582913 RepID=UPI00110599F8|nr:nuclear transport factor 2 family protein [Luteithermobacter gelatinilyticus]
MAMDPRLDDWHRIIKEKDLTGLQQLLHEDVEFNSPFVWTPYQGRNITLGILSSVINVFENFTYHREWVEANDMALEFSATIGDKSLKGVDLIRWNDDGQIIHFEVMIRPGNSLMLLAQIMQKRLAAAGLL